MPWTLYRYILGELLKLLVLTTAVLVVVMSFGAAIQPMSDGKLSPGLLVKFVVFTMPTVLGFALPFAGAFASTLVFIRLANENEILACSASGISYLRILAPVLALGLVLTGGMLYLSNTVVPNFFRLAERTAESDVITLMVSELNTRNHVEFDDQDLVIYADRATQFPPQPIEGSALPMTQLIQLEGVAVGETDGEERIRQDTTARAATLMVFGDGQSEDAWVRLNLENVVRYDPGTGGYSRVDSLRSRPIRIPSPLNDNPKFLSAGDLDAYQREPERHDGVREEIRQLASAMATESLRQAFNAVKDRAVLHGALPGDRYVVSAPTLAEEGEFLRLSAEGDRPVRIDFYADGRVSGNPARTYEASTALVRVRTNALSPEPTIEINLRDVTILGDPSDPGGVAVGNRGITFRQLTWPRFLPEDLEDRRAGELLAEAAAPAYAASDAVASAGNRLRGVVAELRSEIVAQRHERAASAVSCSLLLLLGAVLSIRLKGQAALLVYFWSFILAIVTLIIINSGVNIVGGTPASLTVGMTVLWSGNLLLLLVLVFSYWRMSRT
jgi:lipopolysaccharide export LptBFGC system permease protein LptF